MRAICTEDQASVERFGSGQTPGHRRTVTRNQISYQFFKNVMSLAIVAVASLAITATSASAATLTYDFDVAGDDGATIDGWTDVFPVRAPSFPSGTVWGSVPGGRATGGGARWPEHTSGNQDSQHPNHIMRSPEFSLTATSSVDFQIGGGQGSTNTYTNSSDISPTGNSSSSGQQKFYLRRVSDDTYLLNQRRGSNQNSWQSFTWNSAAITGAIAGDAATEKYTVEWVDTYSGSWGFGMIDDVVLNGVELAPVIHEVGGAGVIDTETLDGTQSNVVSGPLPDLDKVHFWGRSDCCTERASNFNLIIKDEFGVELFNQQQLSTSSEPPYASPHHVEIPLGGTITGAKYVRVVQNYGNTFQVAELQAFEAITGINVAEQSQGGVATAKDSGAGSNPGRAIDGNTDTNWGGGSIWHSGSNAGTWLEIELAQTIFSAALTAQLQPFNAGAGYTYAFELGSADKIEVENPDSGIYTTYLDLNNADFVVEWLGGSPPVTLADGDVFDLLDADILQGTYNSLILPELPAGMEFDDSMFLTDGTLTVKSVIPEPMTMIALGVGISGLGGYIRKRRRA